MSLRITEHAQVGIAGISAGNAPKAHSNPLREVSRMITIHAPLAHDAGRDAEDTGKV